MKQARIGGSHPIRYHPTHSMHVYVHISVCCRCWLRRELGLYRAPACSVARFGQTCKSRTRVSGQQSLITHTLHQLSVSRSRAEASVEGETYRLRLQTVVEGMSTR